MDFSEKLIFFLSYKRTDWVWYCVGSALQIPEELNRNYAIHVLCRRNFNEVVLYFCVILDTEERKLSIFFDTSSMPFLKKLI